MSDLVSKCVLRVEVNDPNQPPVESTTPSESQGAEAKAPDSKPKGKTEKLLHSITVETFPSNLENHRDDWGLLPVSSREQTPMTEKDPVELAEDKGEIGFFSGNPFVEHSTCGNFLTVTAPIGSHNLILERGLVSEHQDNVNIHLSECLPFLTTTELNHLSGALRNKAAQSKFSILTSREDAVTLCILGVPCSMTCHDILAFTAPCHGDISHIRVLRDSVPNQFMCLLTFRDHEAAMEFYFSYNGTPFSSLEPDLLCRIVWVSRVEWAHDGMPPPGHTELPTCPVCLERMDESVDGVLTILCNHAFHASCLEQWGDTTCPVCRCVQSPEQSETSECEKCGKVSPDALWICLICGHVGCGRYLGGHAASHYRESGHCYALQLGSHRVWDYKGDNFVHRLLQNKADGKLIPAEGPASEAECTQEKIDSVQLEFTYLLTSQLEEQRMYFEDKMALLESRLATETQGLQKDMNEMAEENKELRLKLHVALKEKQTLEKKLQQQNAKLSSTLHELNEEKQLGKALRNNQQEWNARLETLERNLTDLQAKKDQEVGELKEQVRDLMFFINAQEVIEKSEDREDIAQGTVTIGATSQSSSRGKKGKKRR